MKEWKNILEYFAVGECSTWHRLRNSQTAVGDGSLAGDNVFHYIEEIEWIF